MKLFTVIIGFGFMCIFSSCQNDAAELINVVSHAIPVANAGSSLTVQLPINTVTLLGTGSSQNGAIASYMWTLVSGPNVPVIQNPGSKITKIDSLVKGSYIFQLAVIDSAGFIGVDTTTVIVKPIPSLPQTLSLDITGSNNEQNFALNNNNNASFQSAELLAYTSPNAAAFQIARGAFKFELGSIPASSTIVSAKLSLFSNPTPTTVIQSGNANGGTNNAFKIFKLNSAFSNSSTWVQQPQMDSASSILVQHTNFPTLDVEVEVKPIVDLMRTQGNNGFLIALQNEGASNLRNFASSTHPNTIKRPKLTIVYQ